jgi:hypothetical protein
MTSKSEETKEKIFRLLVELETCFVAIADVNLPDLEAQIGADNRVVRDIRETCLSGLTLVDTLRLELL